MIEKPLFFQCFLFESVEEPMVLPSSDAKSIEKTMVFALPTKKNFMFFDDFGSETCK